MTVTAITATQYQDHRIHERTLDLALGLAGFADLLVQLGEHLRHLAGDLAGANRLEPLELENVRERGGRRMKRASRRDLGGDLFEDGPELDALTLRGPNAQGLHQRRARADQGRKLVKERQGVFELGPLVRFLRDPRMGHDPFFERQCSPLSFTRTIGSTATRKRFVTPDTTRLSIISPDLSLVH